ncbi:MAG: peptidase C45 acyl-coenzyme A:6-aminopenicillanic acid acyl-transferase [Planctomycetes bacterium]|nr:peptidase C45 acyl-coenzyme A:6-aminopenicillanic acid acyl-transferase [Planctomycetota bacterium]
MTYDFVISAFESRTAYPFQAILNLSSCLTTNSKPIDVLASTAGESCFFKVNPMHRVCFRFLAIAVIGLFLRTAAHGQQIDSANLALQLKPLLNLISGQEKAFGMTASIQAKIAGTVVPIEVRLVRFDDSAFDLDLTHPQYSVSIRRRREETAFALPHHKTVFFGSGQTDPQDHLAPLGIVGRIVSPSSMASVYSALLTNSDANVVSLALNQLVKPRFDGASGKWMVGRDVSFKLGDRQQPLDLDLHGNTVVVKSIPIGEPLPAGMWPGFKQMTIERAELERQLTRGVRRATEVLAPAPVLTSPAEDGRRVDHGELRWIDGHRVVLLEGTPEQIGKAHGELLHDEAIRCVDSVLYSFGTAQTIQTGRWFRHDLENAYFRLMKFIPEDHKRETRALALSLNLDPKLAEVVNVFPEMFHCSGFAVFGSATEGGKLYHGRVLDYMTTIGLQDAATTFIVAPAGKISFANVGYGGFIGSVSGMNTKAISLGEMGGRGEGKWDGVPMATLMRRALEECSTLDEVIDLWKNNPRTCEYYYVFADGKTNRAVGVAALPESIQFVQPGEAHPLLGDGIKDAVVLSAGTRLEELRRRVQSLHGKIDATAAQGLMCRPVAMQSNLHNVLFVPADGVLYVANADHSHPAADRPYVKLNLNELLQSMKAVASTGK